MENSNNINNRSKAFLSKRQIARLIEFVILVGVLAIVVVGFGYIDNLQNQVAERDALIRDLTVSNNLVKEYFDVQYDSIQHTTTYSLKDSKKTQVERTITETKTVDPIFKQGDKTITLDELIENYNKLDNQVPWLTKQNDDLIKKYNELLGRYNALLKKQSETESNNVNLKSALNMIKSSYGIAYEIKSDSLRHTITVINSPKIDSALLLLPHYRDRLQYNNEDKSWTIFLQTKGETAIVKRTKR